MIYLDNNATTKLDDTVFEVMLPYLRENYGNASSIQHKMGRKANEAIENSRKSVADFLHVSPQEIFFTSGSTEAINTVLNGVFERYQSIGNHIITAKTEHKAVSTTCEALEKKGAKVTYLSVDSNGQINLEELSSTITKGTILVALMSANNETGVKNPIHKIADICLEKEVLFFCDATQSIGKEQMDLSSTAIDILCLSAHKFHGPKGVGALFIRRKSRPIQIAPLIIGGKQENGFRGGTYNVPTIAGLGQAIEVIRKQNTADQVAELRNYLENHLITEIKDCKIIAHEIERIPNTSNIHFKHVRSAELMTKLPNIALSSGSACVSGDRDPSHVLLAMGLSNEEALCCVRFSLSKFNTKEEIQKAIEDIKNAVQAIRATSPIWQMYQAGLIE